MMAKPIELYFWPTPNGNKIAIALEEMGLPYVIRPVNIGKGEQFAPEFLKISPNNRMPAIFDPEGPDGVAISVFESGAILQYLGRKSGQFYPKDECARVAVEEWLMWQVANVGPMLGQASHFINYAPKIVDDDAEIAYGRTRYVNEANRLFGVLERRLEGRDFLTGDYSIADMATFPWIRAARKMGIAAESFPLMCAWQERIEARPAVQRGLAAGAELRKALPEKGTAEAAEINKTLFGQTAESVAEAAKRLRGA
jgi:glutathione S-transferase/GST-like protein